MSGFPYAVHNPYSNANGSRSSPSSVSTETLLRNLISSGSGSSATTPQLSSIQAIQEQLVSKRDVQWTVDLAVGLGAVVGKLLVGIHCAKNTDNQESAQKTDVGNAALLLLHAAMEDWEDHLLYAVMVQDCTKPMRRFRENVRGDVDNSAAVVSLLDLITELVLTAENQSTVHDHALNVLALAWRCFDWMQQWLALTSMDEQPHLGNPSDLPWWIEDEHVDRLAALSLGYLTRCFADRDEFGLRQPSLVIQERCKLSALLLVTSLLRRQYLDMSSVMRILPQSQISEITSKLIKGIQILNHSMLPPSSSEYILPIALLSMSVLSMLQQSSPTSTDMFQSLNQTVQSTRLVENIVDFSLTSSTIQGDSLSGNVSRWITPGSKRFPRGFLQSFGMTLMSCWMNCGHAAWEVAIRSLQTKHHHSMTLTWSALLQDQQTPLHVVDRVLPITLCLFQLSRQDTRRCISEAIRKSACLTQSGSQMIQERSQSESNERGLSYRLMNLLFELLRNASGASNATRLLVARLLHLLLSDQRSIIRNDDFSRLLWHAIDFSIVERLWDVVLEYASTEDIDQPLLAVLLDLMTVLTENETCRNHLITKVSAHSIESMIYLVKPKDVRFDFNQTDDNNALIMGTTIESETPPLNNLSRMDETSICVEHEETKQPRGWDMTVRLAAATTLAHLAYGSTNVSSDESIALVLSRISVALNDFLVDYQKMDTATSSMSLDRTRRLFRFQVTMSVPEVEPYLVDTVHALRSCYKKEILRARSHHQATLQELELAGLREKSLQEQMTGLVLQLNSQSAAFQQSISRMKASMAEETRQVVSMHSLERSKAEKRAELAVQEKNHTNAELKKVKKESAEFESIATQARNDLNSASSKADELNAIVNVLQQQVDEEKLRTQGTTEKLQRANEKLESFERKHRTMHEAVNERENVISRFKDSNHQLHTNLEDLFADMCSLSQMYQRLEEHAASQKHKSCNEIDEAKKNIVMERSRNAELDSKVRSLEEENDKLYRKLAKYKERLEQERKERQDEKEQRKEAENRRKRNGPVSYLNSLHNSSATDKSSRHTNSSTDYSSTQRPSSHRSVHDKENGASSYYTNASQRPGLY